MLDFSDFITSYWTVETAGNILDRDSELVLYFNLPDSPSHAEGLPRNSRTRMKIDFRDGQADLFAVQRYVSDKLLGPDTVATSQYAPSMAGHQDAGSGSLLAWLGDDNRMIDASEANRRFRFFLQNCENVELAFKGILFADRFTYFHVAFYLAIDWPLYCCIFPPCHRTPRHVAVHHEEDCICWYARVSRHG